MYQTIEEKINLDHDEIKSNYLEYKNSEDRENARQLYNLIVWEICRHVIAEEIIFYPMVKKYIPNGEETINQLIEQHRRVKKEFSDLESINFNNELFDVKFDLAMEDFNSHIKREESELMEKLVEHCSQEERIDAGKKFENRKKIAPTRPQTKQEGKSPVLESFQSLLSAPVDKFMDLFKEYPAGA